MIVVKVELVSAIHPSRSKELGRMYIANKGDSTDPNKGNYTVGVCRRGTKKSPWEGGVMTRTAEVNDYPRLSYSVWRLIIRALLASFPEEKP